MIAGLHAAEAGTRPSSSETTPVEATAQRQESSRAGSPSSREVLAMLAILLVAFAVRLYGLGSESIWLDEATSIFLARMDIPSLVRWTAVDIHPPLYYILLHFWLAIGDGEAQVRLLSVLIGVATVPAIYVLSRRLFNVWVGLAAASLLALSPLHVWFSQESRMYVLLTLLGLLTAYFTLRALFDNIRAAWLGYVVFAVLSLYTHYYAFFVLLFVNVWALYLLWRGHIGNATYRKWLVAQAISAVIFLPWLPVLISQVRSGGGAWVAYTGVPGLSALPAAAASYLLGPDLHLYAPLVRRLAYAASGLLVVGGVLTLRRRDRRTTVGVTFCLAYLLVPLITAWTISQVKPLYALRYLLPFLPPYYILMGEGLEIVRLGHFAVRRGSSAQMAPSRRSGAAWVLVLALLLAVGSGGILGLASTEQEADWRGIAGYVTSNAQPGDIALFVPGWNVKPFDYYARGGVAEEGNTPIPVEPQAIPSMVAKAAEGRDRFWLVQAEGHYADPQSAVRVYLDATYPRLDQRRFPGGILVSLYRLSP